MLEVKKLGPILEPTNLPFENLAVLNPGVYQDNKNIHIFYRAIDKNHESCIGYARLNGPTEIVERWEKPIISREFEYESRGVEDPRIVKIGDTFYMTYVAHDGKNAVTCYATSSDLEHFKKCGIITPQISYHEIKEIFARSQLKDSYKLFSSFYEEEAGQDVLLWEKDVVFFPEKIKGRYALLHRTLPDIQIAYFDDFSELSSRAFWEDHFRNLAVFVVLENKHWFETRHIGTGAPPIKTKDGWLLIFHAVEQTNFGRVYHASAALLDYENPGLVIGRMHEPLFSPTENWERSGFVSNVVFPTGTAVFDDKLYIYYGAADTHVAVAEVVINELVAELKKPSPQRHASFGGH